MSGEATRRLLGIEDSTLSAGKYFPACSNIFVVNKGKETPVVVFQDITLSVPSLSKQSVSRSQGKGRGASSVDGFLLTAPQRTHASAALKAGKNRLNTTVTHRLIFPVLSIPLPASPSPSLLSSGSGSAEAVAAGNTKGQRSDPR